VTSYRDALVDLADATETEVHGIFDAWEDDLLDDQAFAAVTTGTILAAEDRGVGLADLALAGWLSTTLGRAVPTLGLMVSDADRHATSKAVSTLLARLPDTPDPRGRTARLARGRITQTSGRYFDVGLASRPEVRGYVRGLSPTACELCEWLWKEGYVYPADQPMHRHPGCTCIPIPTTR
jgi:hypothetical protein